MGKKLKKNTCKNPWVQRILSVWTFRLQKTILNMKRHIRIKSNFEINITWFQFAVLTLDFKTSRHIYFINRLLSLGYQTGLWTLQRWIEEYLYKEKCQMRRSSSTVQGTFCICINYIFFVQMQLFVPAARHQVSNITFVWFCFLCITKVPHKF
jgi:hypothetical protein